MILADEMCDGPPGGAKTGFPATDIRREAGDPGPAKGSVRGFLPSCKKCKIWFHFGWKMFYRQMEMKTKYVYVFAILIFSLKFNQFKHF